MEDKIIYLNRLDSRRIKEASERGLVIATGTKKEILERAREIYLGAFDVDGVITYIGIKDGKQYHVSWHHVKSLMPEEFVAEAHANYEWWKEQPLNVKNSREWNNQDAALMKKAGLKKEQILGALKGLVLREGLERIFEIRTKYGMPYAAISFGPRETLEVQGIADNFDVIYSCRFVFDRKGNLVRIVSDTVDANKGTKLRIFAEKYGKKPENVFAVGDSIHDIPFEKSAGVAMHLAHTGYNNHSFNFSRTYEELFDDLPGKAFVVTADTLHPVADTLDYLISQTRK